MNTFSDFMIGEMAGRGDQLDRAQERLRSILAVLRDIDKQCEPDWTLDDEQRVDNIRKLVRGALKVKP